MNRLTRLTVLLALSAASSIGFGAAGAAGSPGQASSGLPSGEATFAGEPRFDRGAPVATDKTIPHWHGQFTDPRNGVTYGYNMVGANPASRTDVTIPVDIIPLKYVFTAYGNATFDATDVADRVVHSPLFQSTDFSSTPAVSGPRGSNGNIPVLPGGALSAGNNGQFIDAYMRAQFNAVGSTYHVRLGLNSVYPTQTIKVSQSGGQAFVNSRGIAYAYQSGVGLSPLLSGSLHLDPTHLSIFLTDNVFYGSSKFCCATGFHGAARSPGNGNDQLPTYIFSAYVEAGTASPARNIFDNDIETLTHELAEWADDPFLNNLLNGWTTTQSATSYGCTPILEVGDPLVDTAFTEPGNTYDTGPYADRSWHLQDSAFLPWMARQAPNTTSQPTQTTSPLGGRYTFLGDLNADSEFHAPAPTC